MAHDPQGRVAPVRKRGPTALPTTRRATLGGLAAAATVPLWPSVAAAQVGPVRELREIADGVYRTRNDRHYGLVVDTDAGVLVFDTINADFAGWLDARIAERLGKPVAYVVYSDNHADHTSGGEVFQHHQPRYVSHELARASHVRSGVATRPADQTFRDGYAVRLGGREIRFRYHGPNDGRGSISALVPDQGVLSVIDWVIINRLPFRELNRYDVEGMLRSVREVLEMDWRLASPGHADMGGKDGVRVQERYVATLIDRTMEQIAARAPMDRVVAEVRAALEAEPAFRQLAQFDAWVEENIRGTHYQLARLQGFADQVLPDPSYAGGRADHPAWSVSSSIWPAA